MLASTPAARAQSNSALADKLFLEGQKLMAEGNPAACEKFADSERLDPALGTLINLALCHEKRGKNATAWGEFTDAAAQARKLSQRDREEFARAHAEALEKKLQKIIVEIPSMPAGTEVRLDGTVLPLTVMGTEIPLDPGDHELVVAAPGKKPWRQSKLNLGPSAVVTRVAVTLEDAGPASAPPVEAGAPLALHPPGVEPSDEGGGSGSGRRTAGFVVGGVGIAGVAVGAVMLGLASSMSHQADREVLAGQVTAGQSDHDTALGDQTVGLVVGGVGIAALVVGTVLVLTGATSGDGKASRPTALRVLPQFGPGSVGAGLGGAF
ncbi:MAG TPA: hypothetical protein VGI39_06655 [Polyangiaceae bacterium]|jgi:hypothetical protein